MVANPYQYTRNPLVIAEIVGLVIENVDMVPDLLNCACVNSIWMEPALRKLYRGSMNDMQFRTPGIDSLNCLLVASPGRFARNVSFVKHLLLAPEYPSGGCGNSSCRPLCFDVCRAMRFRGLAELLLRTQPRGFTSLMIPFEMAHNALELFSDHLGQETVYPAGDFPNLKALTVYISEDDPELGGLDRLLTTRDLQFIHLEEWIGPYTIDHYHRVLSGKLLPYLRAQKNLKALALDLAGCSNPFPEEQEESIWPRLKALYLHCADDQWLMQLSKFKEL
ncbi:hypothetical protein AFCA_013103 [Aspergillus flavus]|nr:hypothetical protein AFCA_013103 [Aspergillus flavus]